MSLTAPVRRVFDLISTFFRALPRRTWVILLGLTGTGAIAIYGVLAAWKEPVGNLLGQATAQIRWMQIPSERANEVLILIAPFQYLGVRDNQEFRRAGEQIETVFKQYAENIGLSLRVEFIPWAISDSGSVSRAESMGARKNATVVIWGDIATTRNEVRYLDRRGRKLHISWSSSADPTRRIDDYERTAETNNSGYAKFVNQDLGNGLAFLAHITVADIQRGQF